MPRTLPVPGQKYTFGVVKAAQARGDLQVLRERGRRALRIHLGADVRAGLAQTRLGDGARVTIEVSRHCPNGPVAQLVEHRTFNAVVAGSSPARLTILSSFQPDIVAS